MATIQPPESFPASDQQALRQVLCFWFICWLTAAPAGRQPLRYGGAHALLFAGWAYGTLGLYRHLDERAPASKITAFLFSGPKWWRLAEGNGAFRAAREVGGSASAPAGLYDTLV